MRGVSAVLVAAVFVAVCGCRGAAPPFEQQPFTTVFRAGEGGYTSFLNPSLVRLASSGRLLVFSEARRGSGGDGAAIDVGFKHSTDRGASWSTLRSIIPNGGGALSHRGSTLGNLVAFAVHAGNTTRAGPAVPTERCVLMLAANNSVGWSIHSDDEGRCAAGQPDIRHCTASVMNG
jgi:hypothetical protein